MLTHLCPSLVIPPHPFDCCFVTPRQRPRPRSSPPHARPRGRHTIECKSIVIVLYGRCGKRVSWGERQAGSLSFVIGAEQFESARGTYTQDKQETGRSYLCTVLYSINKSIPTYPEQVVPVIIFPVGAPRRHGQHRSDNGFSCVFFVTSSYVES